MFHHLRSTLAFAVLVPPLLAGCAATIATPDPLADKGLTSRWVSQPYGTTGMLPDDFAGSPLFVDPAPWPALGARYRAGLAAQGARLTDDVTQARYILRLEGSYRAVAPNGATASASLDELAKSMTVSVGAPPAPPDPMQGYTGRTVATALGVSAVNTMRGVPDTLGNFGLTLGLSAAFEGLASATGARQSLQRGIESVTGVPSSTPLLCGSPQTCENLRLMAHNLTQQILLSVDVMRGEERVLRRTARADGHSKQPTLDEGFDKAAGELAIMTMKE